MSRGLGSIGQVILAAITEADAAGRSVVVLDDAFYRRVFPGLNRIDQKHRVSMLRAARVVAQRSRHLPQYPGDGVRLSDHSWDVDSSHRPARLHHSHAPQTVWATWQTTSGAIQWRKLRPDRWEPFKVIVTLYGRQHSISMLESYSPGGGNRTRYEDAGCQVGTEYGLVTSDWERVTVEYPLFTLRREGFRGWERRHWTPEIEARRPRF